MTAARVLPTATNADDELATLDRAGIAWRIRRLRKDRGWSQTDLADACDIARVTIWRWETADAVPDAVSFCRLADAFHCTLDYLIRGRS